MELKNKEKEKQILFQKRLEESVLKEEWPDKEQMSEEM